MIVSHLIKKIDICFINCEFKKEFANKFTTNIENSYFYNEDSINLKSYSLDYFICFKSRGY